MADDEAAASRSLVAGEGDTLLENDDEHLNLSFDDVDESALMQNLQQRNGPQELLQPPALQRRGQQHGLQSRQEEESGNGASIGGRGLELHSRDAGGSHCRGAESGIRARQGRRFGRLFVWRRQPAKTKECGGAGSTNPYASVRWGPTTQRTSVVPGTTEPLWPRGEALYMDVTHPRWDDDDDDENESCSSDLAKGSSSSTSSESSSIVQEEFRYYSTSAHPTCREQTAQHRIHGSQQQQHHLRSTKVPKPILTVALFHANHNEMHKAGFQQAYGDSDDIFLGMTSVNLTALLTGKVAGSLDQWLPLAGGSSRNKQAAAVRIVCEYEPSDAAPHAGDVVLFTSYCRPADLYPAVPGRRYTVQETGGTGLWDSGGGAIMAAATTTC